MKIFNFVLLIALSMVVLNGCASAEKEEVFMKSLNADWTLQNSNVIEDGGEVLSKISFKDSDWYKTNIPTTVMNALIQNGVYKDVYFGKNLEDIPQEQFENPWWYRKVFTVGADYENARLILEGINYKANIWLNGKLIADVNQIEGAFKIPDLDITSYLSEGENALAIEIIPPKSGDLTIGFVDWNPTPPDNNMGMWRGAYLKLTGSVSLNEVFVQSDVNTETLDEAELNISSKLVNHSNADQNVELKGKIGDVTFAKNFDIKANSDLDVSLNASDIEELLFKNPKLWWPVNLGDPNMYELELDVLVNGKKTDSQKVKFGIRKVEQFINDEGHKGFMVNGHKVLIRGGGWVDDMLLADSDEKVRAQVEYTRHMNLNTIRLEGFWGVNKTIYDAADENGILLMIGWSCHWEWKEYCGREEMDMYMSIDTKKDMELQSDAYADQVKWLRNHPSVFLWVYGSDKLPLPELEIMLEEKLSIADPTRPRLSSCRGHAVGVEEPQDSEVSGPVGVKMRGPYAYVTPNYWYEDTEFGGAYGFNTETGPGPQIPPLESMKRMMPEADLWPMGDMWKYHNGRHAFETLDRYLKAYNARYGEAQSIEEFTFMSQVSNYEAIRAMFEAFSVNKYNATGVIQWMLNSAWPETFWQLYDWYLMPNGAFYGTQQSCEPLHLVYNYGDKHIYLVNEYLDRKEKLSAEIKVYDVNSKLVFSETITTGIEANSSSKVFEIPAIADLSKTYFLHLDLKDAGGNKIDDNFYWLSTKEDVLDFEKTEWHWTPNKSFADLTALKTLPLADVEISSAIKEQDGNYVCDVTLENTSDKIAFFIEFNLADANIGLSVLPVFWDDNYISLLPGEKRTVSAKVSKEDANNQAPVFSYKSMNVK